MFRLAGLTGRLAAARARRDRTQRLYRAAVEAARHPGFYDRLGVEDSVDGRFDMIVLHLHLLLDRLARIAGEGSLVLQRELQEVFVADMDRSLREMGVGDLSVGKKVRTMAAACRGRLEAYAAAGDRAALAAALARNVWRGTAPPGADRVVALADHVDAQRATLAGEPDERLLSGAVAFLPPRSGEAP